MDIIVVSCQEKAEVSFQNKLTVCSIVNCEQLHRVSGLKLKQRGIWYRHKEMLHEYKTVKPIIKADCGDK